MNQTCEVLVIGGGPAGSTIGALLGQRGRDVVVLDKDHHPRFHIGESLLPANLPLLDELGVADEVAAIGMPKHGIEFVSPNHSWRSMLKFSEGWNKAIPYAYQVRRAEFDEILLRKARSNGAKVHEGCKVRDVSFKAPGQGATVTAQHDDGSTTVWETKFLVDASGRDTFLANKFKTKQKNPRHSSAALYAHVEGAQRLPGDLEGNISIFWFEHGWFWFIPLTDGVTSVGAVCWPYYLKSRKTDLTQFFHDTVAMSPQLAERMAGSKLVTDVHATGNYAYSTDRTHGDNYLLLGDAFAFIDPVFSSGVYLAMMSAFEGANAVISCLDEPARAPKALAKFDKLMRKGPRDFSWYIYRVTNPAMRDLFMAPRNVLRTKEALLSMLAGDIYGKTPIGPSLLAFKAIYYSVSLANLRRTMDAWKRRRLNIRDPEAA